MGLTRGCRTGQTWSTQSLFGSMNHLLLLKYWLFRIFLFFKRAGHVASNANEQEKSKMQHKCSSVYAAPLHSQRTYAHREKGRDQRQLTVHGI